VDTFFDWVDRCGGRVRSVLELGSHEGSHSLQLAERPDVVRVVGLEGREDNLARARLVQKAFGATNVEFRHCDLDHFDPADHGTFDAVFCAGLLYHLSEPWTLLERLADTGRFLFLDTHYAASDEVAVGRYRGRWFSEGDDALSGLSERAFWLTFKHVAMLLLESRFVIRFVRDIGETVNGPRVWIFAERVSDRGAGCIWPPA
jgi:SAM-dependent methyltransferase